MPLTPSDAVRDVSVPFRPALLGALAIVWGTAVLRPHACSCTMPKRQIATLGVQVVAFERYPRWRLAHPDQPCPASLREMLAKDDISDPWGTPVAFLCRAGTMTVWSAGDDRLFGTDDDIRSDR